MATEMPRLEVVIKLYECTFWFTTPAIRASVVYRLCRGGRCAEVTAKERGWVYNGRADFMPAGKSREGAFRGRECRLLAVWRPGEEPGWMPRGWLDEIGRIPGSVRLYRSVEKTLTKWAVEGLAAYRPRWKTYCEVYALEGGMVVKCDDNPAVLCFREGCDRQDVAVEIVDLLPPRMKELAWDLLEASGWDPVAFVGLLASTAR